MTKTATDEKTETPVAVAERRRGEAADALADIVARAAESAAKGAALDLELGGLRAERRKRLVSREGTAGVDADIGRAEAALGYERDLSDGLDSAKIEAALAVEDTATALDEAHREAALDEAEGVARRLNASLPQIARDVARFGEIRSRWGRQGWPFGHEGLFYTTTSVFSTIPKLRLRYENPGDGEPEFFLKGGRIPGRP